MGLGNALADAMLTDRVAGAESQAHWAGVRMRDAERDYERSMSAAKQEIANLRATVAQQQHALNKTLAQSLCAQAIAGGLVKLMLKNEGHPQLEKIRLAMAQEARLTMKDFDSKNLQNPQWVSLVETCKTFPLNEHYKVI